MIGDSTTVKRAYAPPGRSAGGLSKSSEVTFCYGSLHASLDFEEFGTPASCRLAPRGDAAMDSDPRSSTPLMNEAETIGEQPLEGKSVAAPDSVEQLVAERAKLRLGGRIRAQRLHAGKR